VQVVRRAGFEFRDEMGVEGAGFFGLGVNQDAPTADVVRQLNESHQNVLEEARTESPAFMLDVYPEAGQEGDRLRVAPGAPAESAGRIGGVKLGHAPGVVSDDLVTVVFRDDKDPRGARARRLAGVSVQPVGLLGGEAPEASEVVVVGKELRGPVHALTR
jgi:hypothetical protein